MLDGFGWESTPKLGEEAERLIGLFDENAWLDLLSDGALQAYAESTADDEEWDRLEEVSAELRYRKMQMRVAYGIELGVGADRVQDQVDRLVGGNPRSRGCKGGSSPN